MMINSDVYLWLSKFFFGTKFKVGFVHFRKKVRFETDNEWFFQIDYEELSVHELEHEFKFFKNISTLNEERKEFIQLMDIALRKIKIESLLSEKHE